VTDQRAGARSGTGLLPLARAAATDGVPDLRPPPDGGPPAGSAPGWTRTQRRILAGIALVLFGAYATYSWARHAKYETTGFDLGIFDQVVRAYAHLHAPTSPLKNIDYNILGDHFHPILVVLAPLYWIWDDPRVLLTVQAALFAVSIFPVAAFARRRFGAVPALVLAAGYGASWPIEQAVQFDFHEIAFAVPLIALIIDAMDRRANRTLVTCCLLVLLVREDMGAMVLLVGLLVAARRPLPGRGRRADLVLGGLLAGAGLLGYWVATSLVIPALGGGFAYWTFTALGPDPVSALRYSVGHPLQVLRLMVTPAVKLHTLETIFYPTGYLALFSPYALLTVPFLAERMLNDRPQLWITNFHYTSVIAPMLMAGAVDTVARLHDRFPAAFMTRRLRRLRRVPVGLVAAFVAWSVGVVTFGLVTQGANYPVAGLWSGRVWVRDARWHDVNTILPLIPSGECVEAYNQIAPHLTQRDYVTRVTFSGGLATWVVLDMSQPDTGWQSPLPGEALRISEINGYVPVAWVGSVVLLHKNQPIAPICRGLY
jgi:uncharacterized membrane protein